MRLIASKYFNRGKDLEQLGTKSKRLSTRKKQKGVYKKVLQSKNKNDTRKFIHHILSPNPKTLKVDPEKFNKFFNKPAERLVRKGNTDSTTVQAMLYTLLH